MGPIRTAAGSRQKNQPSNNSAKDGEVTKGRGGRPQGSKNKPFAFKVDMPRPPAGTSGELQQPEPKRGGDRTMRTLKKNDMAAVQAHTPMVNATRPSALLPLPLPQVHSKCHNCDVRSGFRAPHAEQLQSVIDYHHAMEIYTNQQLVLLEEELLEKAADRYY